MAQSFGIPSRNCSVAEFDAARAAAGVDAVKIAQSWKGFCDCMFIEMAEVTDFEIGGIAVIRCMNGKCKNQNDGTELTATPDQCAKWASGEAARRGVSYSVNIYGTLNPTPEWAKCMSNFCLAPGGCPNPAVPSLMMPFNADPGSSLSPWTDVGAAARMIPKRNAGFFYDVTAALHIDLHAYEPLKLWQTFWKNPVLFGWLMLKIQLIPVAGAAYSLSMTGTGPPIFLIPGALESAARQGLDPVKEVFEVAGMGLIEQAKFLVAYIGKCGFGIPGACGVAMAVQKAAQDQIDTGEINNVASKEGKAIIIFLAKNGSDLVDSVMSVLANPEKGFVLVFTVLQTGFEAVARMLGTDPDVQVMKKTCEIIGTIFGIAAIIAKGIDSRTPALMVVDNVADYLLGFRPSEYFALMAAGKKQSALDSAQASMNTKGMTVEDMIERAKAITDVLDKIITELSKIAQKIGGAFDDVLQVLGGIRSDVGSASAAVVTVGNEIDGVTRQALGLPANVTPNTISTTAATEVMPAGLSIAQQKEWVMTHNVTKTQVLNSGVPVRAQLPGSIVLTATNAAVLAARQKLAAQAEARQREAAQNGPPVGTNITNQVLATSGPGPLEIGAGLFLVKTLFLKGI